MRRRKGTLSMTHDSSHDSMTPFKRKAYCKSNKTQTTVISIIIALNRSTAPTNMRLYYRTVHIGTMVVFVYAFVALIISERALRERVAALEESLAQGQRHALLPPPSRRREQTGTVTLDIRKLIPSRKEIDNPINITVIENVPSPQRRPSRSNNTNNDTDNAFSACLLTMDDNHYLIEWLAYHYHTLPLRHLIVAVDPHSKTSPAPILDRYRNLGMTIETMKDDDFMTLNKDDIESMNEFGRSTRIHRKRQRSFYKACMQKHKQKNRSWVLLIDVDEYLAFNRYTKKRKAVDTQKPTTVASFLQHELARRHTKLQRSPCIIIPRLRYGAKESAPELVSKNVPKGLNASAFQTLRFRKHAPLGDFKRNRYPKTIIDVSRLGMPDLKWVNDPHMPLKARYPKEMKLLKVADSPLVVRHYVGTWEQFTFRDDVRDHDGHRDASEKFKEYRDMDFGDDDGVRPWLEEFVQNVGSETAMNLLQGVGEVSHDQSNKMGGWMILSG